MSWKSLFCSPLESLLAAARLAGSYIRRGGKLPVLVVVVAVFLFAAVMYARLNCLAGRANPTGPTQIDGSTEYSWWRYRALYPADYIADDVSVPATCDLSDGDWVFDDSYPTYRESSCEFLSKQVSCLQNGRPESKYQKWRWQPKNCSLPRFDARRMLEWLRGKRMLFVGDSINRNQWESMVCLMQTAVPRGRRSRIVDGSLLIFPIKEYRASIEFYWAPFLVASNSDAPEFHSIPVRIIDPDAVEKHAAHWKGADVLVFNSYIWWMNDPQMKVLRPGAGNWTEHDEIGREEAYERALRTVFHWVDRSLNPNSSAVFFMSRSPAHDRSTDWGKSDGIKCAKETEPIQNMTGVPIASKMWEVARKVAGSTARVPVTFLDITAMSAWRKDAHASVYTMRQGKLLSPEQKADPAKFADCIHWCVPGLPDTWNQLLYARLLSRRPPQ
ncbi:protein trichome birefringence-like 28 [Zingiber officinale]|uniref:protein trichome birefringence-like 28 n=1 Tax=Zingiber officinale TaxID=94328 RepID=UPI001C4CED36|nr:protein trichome birefringence-like 28 [Zingiber officinale]